MTWPPRVWRTPDTTTPRRVNTTFGELMTDDNGNPAHSADDTQEETTDGDHDHA